MAAEKTVQTAFWNRDNELLLEMALATAVFGIYVLLTLASILNTIERVDPHLLEQRYYAEQLESALLRYSFSMGEYPGGVDIPEDEHAALPICRQFVEEAEGCVVLDALIPDYISSIPVARNTRMRSRSGYVVFLQRRMPTVAAEFTWESSASFPNRSL